MQQLRLFPIDLSSPVVNSIYQTLVSQSPSTTCFITLYNSHSSRTNISKFISKDFVVSTMALDRLKSVSQHISGPAAPHPFDPLSNAEIESAAQAIRKTHGKVYYNAITLWEPRKKEMLKWLANPESIPKPKRIADVVVIVPGGKVFDGLVDLGDGKILKWEQLEGVQPLVSPEVNSGC